jgi:hypothetical protein
MAAEQTAEQTADMSVVLQYKRVDQLSSGCIVLLPVNGFSNPPTACLDSFEKIPFTKMLTYFARELRSHPKARASILRVDRPGLLPYHLDEETTNLFRTDPVSAIRSMTYESVSASGTRVKKDTTPLEAAPIRSCYDTLADAFGDVVYARNRNSVIECPGCGYWGVAHTILNQTLFQCTKSCAVSGKDINLRLTLSKLWAGIEVKDLLATPLEKFYLPRPWNDGRSWITRAELAEKYTAYKTEKETTCSALKMATR